LARFSKRSLANVVSFMSTGILTATVCGSGCPLATYLRSPHDKFIELLPTKTSEIAALIAVLLIFFMAANVQLRSSTIENRSFPKGPATNSLAAIELMNSKKKFFPAALSAALFASGLAISGMCKPSKIYGFLDLSGIRRGTWDPTLLCVMASGMAVSMLGYQFVKGYGIFGEVRLITTLSMIVPTVYVIFFSFI
jgi:hypothetical protein